MKRRVIEELKTIVQRDEENLAPQDGISDTTGSKDYFDLLLDESPPCLEPTRSLFHVPRDL